MSDVIEVAGAGPAGLAAAITLAQAGANVVVHEARAGVGYRFGRDLQGLENWTTQKDVLKVFSEFQIATGFRRLTCTRGQVLDANGNRFVIDNREPLFYMVERGLEPGSFDSALTTQALELNVEIRYNSRVERLNGPGILATGPKAGDAIAVGYHFETDMEDGFWAICDDRLAPKGYAYLLVMEGQGTVKSCMFTGFKHEREYVARTVAAFERLAGLRMKDPQAHGGAGNFRIPGRATSGIHPVVGELAGFQDMLWGFGIRHAVRSGILAARALLNGEDYEALWQRELRPAMEAALVNRVCYSLLGNQGYRLLLKFKSRGDVREFLRRRYAPSMFKRVLLPWARRRYRSQRQDKSCNHVDCGCVWCRCGGDSAAPSVV